MGVYVCFFCFALFIGCREGHHSCKKNLIAMVFPREPNDDDNNNNNKHFCSAVQS